MATLTRQADGRFEIAGMMTFETAGALLGEVSEVIQPRADVQIDLQQVERIDSAGLALVVECLRLAKQRQASVEITGESEQALALARTSNLQFLFGRSAAGETASTD